MKLEEIYQNLVGYITGFKKVVVAFSGGVDSALLAYVAYKALGDNMLAVTVKAPYTPTWEFEEALDFAREHGFRHEIIDFPLVPTEITLNPPDRCYLCKLEIFDTIIGCAEKNSIQVVFDGSNKDDLKDYRPGMKALEELNIKSPMLDLGITKDEIRKLSHHFKLKTWNKPSCACLLSRIPYNTEIKIEELAKIEKAELILRQYNIIGSRVRSHGDIARIEAPADRIEFLVSPRLRAELVAEIKKLGYLYVVVDLEGYQTGSLNKTLNLSE